ncbi:MAG: nucleotidyltransferase family protein [Gemmatimonadaceae bacterium]|nr:nucleotidyltransferase family protein [Gemmatimonadaceae bacterium]
MRRAIDRLWRTLAPTTVADDDLRRSWVDPQFLDGLWPLVQAEDLGPWLAVRLHELGIVLPAPWHDALAADAAQGAAQALLLKEEVRHVAALLDDAQIPVALLKGAARAWLGGSPLVRARHVADCDLLVPAVDVPRVMARLAAAGYVRVGEGAPPGHWHADPVRREQVTVEVHHALDAEAPAERVWQQVRAHSRPLPVGRTSVLLPDVAELVWHALRHRLASPRSWLRFRLVADLASLLPQLDAAGRARLRERLADEPASVVGRLAPLVRCVSAFASDPLADDLGLPTGEATPMRDVLLWRLAELWRHEDGASRRVESGRMAPYFVLGHEADAVVDGRSVPRRMLDALAVAEFRRMLEDQPAS